MALHAWERDELSNCGAGLLNRHENGVLPCFMALSNWRFHGTSLRSLPRTLPWVSSVSKMDETVKNSCTDWSISQKTWDKWIRVWEGFSDWEAKRAAERHHVCLSGPAFLQWYAICGLHLGVPSEMLRIIILKWQTLVLGEPKISYRHH